MSQPGVKPFMGSMHRPTPTSLMLRRMTASVVLDALRAGGPMTGSDLICHRAGPAHHPRGLQRPDPAGRSARRRAAIPPATAGGPTARCYEFQSRAGLVLGIDATDRVTARLADLRGDCVAEASQPLAHVSVPVDERLDAVRRTTDGVPSAAVDPGHVLAVAVGVPTPVDAEGLPVGREAYLPGLPGRDLRPRSAAATVGRCCSRTTPTWPPGERWRGVAAGVDDLVVMVADERPGSGLFPGGRPAPGHAALGARASSSWSSGSAAPTASPTCSDPRRRGRCRPG